MAEEPDPELLSYATGEKYVKIRLIITEAGVTFGSHGTPFMLRPVVSRVFLRRRHQLKQASLGLMRLFHGQAIPINNYFPAPQNIPGLFEGENSCRISFPRQYIRS